MTFQAFRQAVLAACPGKHTRCSIHVTDNRGPRSIEWEVYVGDEHRGRIVHAATAAEVIAQLNRGATDADVAAIGEVA